MDGEKIARLEEQMKYIREDVKEMKRDMKTLLEFRWRLYGATAVIAFLVASAAEGIVKIMEHSP